MLGLGLDPNSACKPEWNDIYYIFLRRCAKTPFRSSPVGDKEVFDLIMLNFELS